MAIKSNSWAVLELNTAPEHRTKFLKRSADNKKDKKEKRVKTRVR